MAAPYRKIYHRIDKKWSIKEIAELYIDRNYSMNLVSKITGISLPILSRILWQYELPDVKRAYYGDTFKGEKKALSASEKNEFYDIEHIFKRLPNAEDDFFSGL